MVLVQHRRRCHQQLQWGAEEDPHGDKVGGLARHKGLLSEAQCLHGQSGSMAGAEPSNWPPCALHLHEQITIWPLNQKGQISEDEDPGKHIKLCGGMCM